MCLLGINDVLIIAVSAIASTLKTDCDFNLGLDPNSIDYVLGWGVINFTPIYYVRGSRYAY